MTTEEFANIIVIIYKEVDSSLVRSFKDSLDEFKRINTIFRNWLTPGDIQPGPTKK